MVNPIEIIDVVLDAMIPPINPPEEATAAEMKKFHDRQRRYRRRATLVACTGFMISVTFSSWALGAFTVFGTKGFALAVQVERYETMQLDKYLTDYRISQCVSSGVLKRFYTDKIRWLGEAWVELHHQKYDMPSCLELGILEAPP